MTKLVQAYFHTENEAEDVRIKLQFYKIEQIEIGALPEPLNSDKPLLIPFTFAAASASAAGDGGYAGGARGTGAAAADASAAGTYVGLRAVDEDLHDHNEDGIDDRDLLYSLSAKVRDEDYEEVVQVIRRNGGHVDLMDEA